MSLLRVWPLFGCGGMTRTKALMIIESEHENNNFRGFVLCLGGFHTEISFLVSIGYLMNVSGLQEMLFTLTALPPAPHHLQQVIRCNCH